MQTARDEYVDIRHFHFFCGLGGGARGFNRGQARVGRKVARFRCIGGIDNDAAAVRDFKRLAGVPATRLDLFSRDQYRAFHGREPGPDWREASTADIHRAAGGERPHIVFLSAPCKGFSGLLSETQSRTGKYQALNGLTLRGVWLMLEAWKDDPPELIIFENVPRIATRGRFLLDQIIALLRSYGYAVAETTHDCGVIGGLAQSRKRFLLVARHEAKVPPFLYEPVKRRLRGVGEVLEKLPVPGAEAVLPMHRMPSLHWKTWVRLAFVEAGSDWRSLNKLKVNDGVLAGYGIAPDVAWRNGALGVTPWDEPAGTITGNGRPATGAFNVADPRIDGHEKSVQMGVRRWDQTAGVVTGKMFVGGGPHSVADPRIEGKPRFNNTFRIVPWRDASPAVAGPGGPAGGLAVADPRAESGFGGKGKYRVTGFDEPAGAVIGASTTGQGACAVADPRTGWPASAHQSKFAVQDWEQPSKTVTGSDRVGSGALCVADPRPEAFKDGKEAYTNGGHYGVVPWEQPSYAVTGSGQHDNGRWSVADPRSACETERAGAPVETVGDKWGEYHQPALPSPDARLVAVIRALDGTWHRPFTTLELAALQGLVDLDDELSLAALGFGGPVIDAVRGKHGHLVLDGSSDSAHRERIGNAVPSDAAEAVAGVMGETLLLAWSGETFMLSAKPIWVRNVAVGLMAAQG